MSRFDYGESIGFKAPAHSQGGIERRSGGSERREYNYEMKFDAKNRLKGNERTKRQHNAKLHCMERRNRESFTFFSAMGLKWLALVMEEDNLEGADGTHMARFLKGDEGLLLCTISHFGG